MDTVPRTDPAAGDIRKQVVSYLVSSGLLQDVFIPDGATPGEVVRQIRFIRVQGTSMLPALKSGDIIVALPLFDRPPQIGEMVLIPRDSQAVVVHRVVKADPAAEVINTKGDSRVQGDGPIPWCSCPGRVVGVVKDNRIIKPPPPPHLFVKWLIVFGLLAKRLAGRAKRIFPDRH